MIRQTHITIEIGRYAELVDALKLARYALLRSGRRFDCPPHDAYTVAHTIDAALAKNNDIGSEVRS